MAVTTEIELDPEKEYEIVDGQPEEKNIVAERSSGINSTAAG